MGYAGIIPVLGGFFGHVSAVKKCTSIGVLTALCNTQSHAFLQHMVSFVHCKQTSQHFAQLRDVCTKEKSAGWCQQGYTTGKLYAAFSQNLFRMKNKISPANIHRMSSTNGSSHISVPLITLLMIN